MQYYYTKPEIAFLEKLSFLFRGLADGGRGVSSDVAERSSICLFDVFYFGVFFFFGFKDILRLSQAGLLQLEAIMQRDLFSGRHRHLVLSVQEGLGCVTRCGHV
jgi:hypothetical protein